MSSPTQRTLALLKKDGYRAQVVEKWNMFAHVRQDLFGFIDVIAFKPDQLALLGIQTTSREHVGERIAKILKLEIANEWLSSGNKIEVWGWSKKGKAGKRKLWQVYKEEITPKSFI